MRVTKGLSAGLLGLTLAMFLNACADAEFKGKAKSTVAKTKTEDSRGVSDARPQTSPAVPTKSSPNASPIASQDVEIPRIVAKAPTVTVSKFFSSSVKQNSFAFSLDTQSVSTGFALTDINGSKTQSHTQITRTATTDSFKQGTVGTAINQSFTQKAEKGLVDILVVIDDSGSMIEEQTNLSNKLSALLTSIKGSSWQIGVVTTSVQAHDACLMTLIKSTDADAENKFKAAVSAGTGGNSNEAGIKQAVIGLGCSSNPWLRSNATTAVLVVSDADNCSNDGGDCGQDLWNNESYLINYAEQTLKKEFWKNFGVYGIFSLPSNKCSASEQVGTQYQRLMDYKNGSHLHKNAGNICQDDYSATLNQISADIALLLENQFELSEVPDSSPVRISIDGAPVPAADYTLVNKTLTFKPGKEPSNGKVLVVDYNTGAVPRFSSVTLKNDPALETIVVKVGASPLPSSAYTLSGRTLTFKSQPADNASITVDYRIAKALANTFQLEKIPVAGTLAVSVDAQAATGMSYDAIANQVVFQSSPIDGAAITIRYDYRIGPNLTYTLPSAAGAFNHVIYDGSVAIPFTKTGDSYTIRAANHVPGKVLMLKYEAPDATVHTFDLPSLPVGDSVVFTKEAAECKLGRGITVNGKRLTVNCAVTVKTEIEMSYSSLETFSSFTTDVEHPETGIWEVLIDGVRFESFTRVGNTITIDYAKYLRPGQQITIRHTEPERPS
jgi:hypothetical protein